MNNPNQLLLNYISEQMAGGASAYHVKQVLLQNDWMASTIDEAFSTLGITLQNNPPLSSADIVATYSHNETFTKEGLTMDKIIEKFIPITGALLLLLGLAI